MLPSSSSVGNDHVALAIEFVADPRRTGMPFRPAPGNERHGIADSHVPELSPVGTHPVYERPGEDPTDHREGVQVARTGALESVRSGVASAESAAAVPAWRELFARGLARTTVGLLLMEGLVAVQVLVTVAVLPAVVSDLGGVRLFGAALSASQVATVIVLPFTPGLVTRWGLRGAFYVSLGTFVVGSLVVISAPTSWVFVAGLFLEGAGAGAQYALLLAIFTRRYPLRLRPRMYAALAVAWAVPGLLGPAYGGLVASTLGWRWAFALLLPLVVPAVWMLHPSLTDPDETDQPEAPSAPAQHRPCCSSSRSACSPCWPPSRPRCRWAPCSSCRSRSQPWSR